MAWQWIACEGIPECLHSLIVGTPLRHHLAKTHKGLGRVWVKGMCPPIKLLCADEVAALPSRLCNAH